MTHFRGQEIEVDPRIEHRIVEEQRNNRNQAVSIESSRNGESIFRPQPIQSNRVQPRP